MFHCYFASIFYSIADVFYMVSLCSFVHFILCRMCVCHTFIKVLTYLLTLLITTVICVDQYSFTDKDSVDQLRLSYRQMRSKIGCVVFGRLNQKVA